MQIVCFQKHINEYSDPSSFAINGDQNSPQQVNFRKKAMPFIEAPIPSPRIKCKNNCIIIISKPISNGKYREKYQIKFLKHFL